MNPNELMIGDLVYAGKNVIHVTAATIGIWKCEGLKPIPLTEEVLVKSGFPRNKDEEDKQYWSDTDKDTYRLYDFNSKYPYFKLIEVILPDEHYFWVEDHCTIKIRYVHEFQHLLKLCGIEKEVMV